MPDRLHSSGDVAAALAPGNFLHSAKMVSYAQAEEAKVLPQQARLRQRSAISKVVRVDEHDQTHLVSLLSQHARHFKCDQSSEAAAAYVIRSVRLNRADLFNVEGSGFFHSLMRLAAIQTFCLQAVERLVFRHR